MKYIMKALQLNQNVRSYHWKLNFVPAQQNAYKLYIELNIFGKYRYT